MRDTQHGVWSGRRRLASVAAVVLALAAATLAAAQGQRIWGGYYGSTPPRFPTPTSFDGGFNFCRVMFSSNRREKQGWSTDYPGADINFSIRLGELTKVQVRMAPSDGEQENPDAVVVRLTDDALFHCPFTFMEDAGTAQFTDEEVVKLRQYLSKGGFLLVSDYHGWYAREQFDAQIRKALPLDQFPLVDLTPPDHPIWHTFFDVKEMPQMASIQTWRRSGGSTIERWNTDAAPPDVRGIADAKGRIVVVMVHNTDLPDPWEREGEDHDYFFRFSPDAYAAGIDILLYGMTH
jgi:hypothetical protein